VPPFASLSPTLQYGATLNLSRIASASGARSNSLESPMRTAIAASVLGIVVLSCSFVVSVQGQQNPPSGPVTVVNTNANPVPVRAPAPLPISGSVAVTGTSNVNVTNAVLPVSGGVSVTNTPTVNVNSSVATPLLVQSIDAAKRHPFQMDDINFSFDSADVTVNFTVPANRRLEITFVSGQIKLGTAGQDMWCRMETTFQGVVSTHWLDGKDQGFFGTRQRQFISQPVVAYADPGSAISVMCSRSILVDAFDLETTISGTYTDVP